MKQHCKHSFKPILALLLVLGLSAGLRADTEPNNSIAEANTVVFGSISGTINPSGDPSDFYQTTLPANGTVTLSVSFSGTITGRIGLYNASGSFLGWSAVGSTTSVSFSCIASGLVFFQVNATAGSGPEAYTASISVAEPGFSNDLEPNNTVGSAFQVLLPDVDYEGQLGFTNGSASPLDNADVYRAIMPGDGTLTANGLADGSLVYRFNLFNGDGALLITGPSSSSPSLSFSCLAGDTVYLQMQLISGCGGYSFSYSIAEPIYANDAEPNNSIALASQVIMPATSYEGHLGFSNGSAFPLDNSDIYQAIVPGNGTLSASGVADGSLVYRFLLYNGDGTLLITGPSSSSPSLSFSCLAADTVYLQVQAITGCGGYSFSYSVAEPVYANDAEPNNSVGEALEVLMPDTDYEGQLGFVNGLAFPLDASDFYRIVLPSNGTLTANGVADGDLNYRFGVYNADGSLLVFGISNDSPSVSFSCLAADTIFLQLQRIAGCGGYSFRYAVDEPAFANDAEPNNTIGTALPIAPNFPVQGQLGFTSGSDTPLDLFDFYTFSGQGPGLVTFSATCSPSLTARLALFNSAGTLLLVGGASSNPTLSSNLLVDGTYYVRVERISGCGGYELNFDNGCPLPVNLSEQVISVGARLKWNAAPAAGSFELQRGPAGGPYSVFATNFKSNIWFPLTEATDYEWQAQSVCGGRVSGYTPLRAFTTLAEPVCPLVQNVVVDSVSPTSATLSWDANILATGYRIEYRVASSAGGTGINTTSTSGIITGLTPGTNYEYRVRQNCVGDGISPWRNGTFSTPSSRLAQLSDLELWPVPADQQLQLSWTAEQAGSYRILISDLNGRTLMQHRMEGLAGGNQVSLSLGELPAGLYHLQLIAADGAVVVKPFGKH